MPIKTEFHRQNTDSSNKLVTNYLPPSSTIHFSVELNPRKLEQPITRTIFTGPMTFLVFEGSEQVLCSMLAELWNAKTCPVYKGYTAFSSIVTP